MTIREMTDLTSPAAVKRFGVFFNESGLNPDNFNLVREMFVAGYMSHKNDVLDKEIDLLITRLSQAAIQ